MVLLYDDYYNYYYYLKYAWFYFKACKILNNQNLFLIYFKYLSQVN